MKLTRCILLAVLIPALVALALVVAACGCGEEETTTTTQGATTTTQAETTTTQGVTTTTQGATTTTQAETTTTTEELSSAETLLPNGNIQAMGYIDKAWEDGGKRYISIDYAEMLTGQEADDAAGTDVEYYITNENPQKREFEVSDTVSINRFSTTRGEVDEPVTWDTFMSYWSDSPPPTDADFPYNAATSPWWIERDGPLVVKIDQQYLP